MKVLTLTQPWASLVAIRAKKIETRSWRTGFRGPLAIHAAKGFPKWAQNLCFTEPFAEILRVAGYISLREHTPYARFWKERLSFPRGVIVATCELVDCVEIRSIRPSYGGKTTRDGEYYNHQLIEYAIPPDEPELSFGDYSPGRYALLLENIKPLPEPVPAKGALGLWEWPEHV